MLKMLRTNTHGHRCFTAIHLGASGKYGCTYSSPRNIRRFPLKHLRASKLLHILNTDPDAPVHLLIHQNASKYHFGNTWCIKTWYIMWRHEAIALKILKQKCVRSQFEFSSTQVKWERYMLSLWRQNKWRSRFVGRLVLCIGLSLCCILFDLSSDRVKTEEEGSLGEKRRICSRN